VDEVTEPVTRTRNGAETETVEVGGGDVRGAQDERRAGEGEGKEGY